MSWREGTKGTLSKQMVALRVHRATGSPTHSIDHELVLTAAEGWLIAERPLRPAASSSAYKENEGDEELNYYSTLGAEVSLERLASVAKSRSGPSSNSTREGRVRPFGLPGQEVGGSAPAPGALDASLLLPDATFERYNWHRLFF
jgi:hypothetical protein